MVVEGLLSPEELAELKVELSRADYMPLPLGDGAVMSVCALSQTAKSTIADAIEAAWGKPLSIIELFCRYNSPGVDTSFRIHSDGLIQGLEPDVASVLYLTTGHTGTGLFEHPEHGTGGKGKIFTEDDGQWKLSEFSQEKENNAFIYDANRFHSRWPPQADHHRFVIVGFYQEV